MHTKTRMAHALPARLQTRTDGTGLSRRLRSTGLAARPTGPLRTGGRSDDNLPATLRRPFSYQSAGRFFRGFILRSVFPSQATADRFGCCGDHALCAYALDAITITIIIIVVRSQCRRRSGVGTRYAAAPPTTKFGEFQRFRAQHKYIAIAYACFVRGAMVRLQFMILSRFRGRRWRLIRAGPPQQIPGPRAKCSSGPYTKLPIIQFTTAY